MTNSAIQSMQSIDRFLQEVAATEKKAAEAHTEPGSVGGPTQHPVKDVDDLTEDAQEGERSAENEADVSADQGPPSVDNTEDNVAAKKAVDGKSEDGSVNPPGTASADQLQIGTKKEPTGEEPAVETSSAKGGKEDAGSSHPARTDNEQLDSLKYAEMNTEQLSKVAADLGNVLLAGLSKSAASCSAHDGDSDDDDDDDSDEKEAELKGDQDKLDADGDGKIEGSDLAELRNDDSDDDEKEATDLAGQAGWELAGLLSGNFDKKAANSLVKASLVDMISTASTDAEKVAEFLTTYAEAVEEKQAAEMPAGIDPAAMMGGEEAPMEADEAGMAEAMAGGEGGSEVEQLAAVLESIGISPEELEAAMAEEAGGMGEEAPMGGEDPMGGEALMGEAPVAETADEAPGMEVEASEKAAVAKKGAARKATKDYIQEVLERSRR